MPMAERVARQHSRRAEDLDEARGEARRELGRLLDAFDYRRPARFAPYANLDLLKRFARRSAGPDDA